VSESGWSSSTRSVLLASLTGPCSWAFWARSTPRLYDALFDNYAALLRRNLVEDDYEDTIPPTNQNVW
jgi:hypothetical protein